MRIYPENKQSVYLPDDLLVELRRHQRRLDRSLSWVVQRCVTVALREIRKLPGPDDHGRAAQ